MLIAVLAALLIGGVFYLAVRRNRRGAASSAAWPSVEGRITASAVVTRRDRDDGTLDHLPEIAFAYEVGGRSYTGHRVRFGLTRYGPGPANALCARYPPGLAVPVYYDPAKPAQSVLEPGTRTG